LPCWTKIQPQLREGHGELAELGEWGCDFSGAQKKETLPNPTPGKGRGRKRNVSLVRGEYHTCLKKRARENRGPNIGVGTGKGKGGNLSCKEESKYSGNNLALGEIAHFQSGRDYKKGESCLKIHSRRCEVARQMGWKGGERKKKSRARRKFPGKKLFKYPEGSACP